MITIRNNVFETNSSSTHTLIIGTDEEVTNYMDGQSWYSCVDEANGKFVGMEFIKNWFTKKCKEGEMDEVELKQFIEPATFEELDEVLEDTGYSYEFKSYNHLVDELEEEDGYYTSPSGDKLRWIAAYGYDC